MNLHLYPIGVIGNSAKFYGYIVGLQLERGDLPNSPDVPARMFARFEYSGTTSIWEVPDHELFGVLAGHLADSARTRGEYEDWGNAKLTIEKIGGCWNVEIP